MTYWNGKPEIRETTDALPTKEQDLVTDIEVLARTREEAIEKATEQAREQIRELAEKEGLTVLRHDGPLTYLSDGSVIVTEVEDVLNVGPAT